MTPRTFLTLWTICYEHPNNFGTSPGLDPPELRNNWAASGLDPLKEADSAGLNTVIAWVRLVSESMITSLISVVPSFWSFRSKSMKHSACMANLNFCNVLYLVMIVYPQD